MPGRSPTILRIWGSWGSIDSRRGPYIGEVVYSRERLVDAWHTLDAPLEPSSDYFWSVRAHFVQDGKQRVTEWSRYSLTPTKVTNALTMGIASLIPKTPGLPMVDMFYPVQDAPQPPQEVTSCASGPRNVVDAGRAPGPP